MEEWIGAKKAHVRIISHWENIPGKHSREPPHIKREAIRPLECGSENIGIFTRKNYNVMTNLPLPKRLNPSPASFDRRG